MSRNRKTLAAVAASALMLAPTVATPAHAMAVCHVVSPGAHGEFGQIVTIAGVYRGPADAVEVELTCGVVHNGGTILRVTDKLVGPVAALAEVRQVFYRGLLTSCYEVTVTHQDGSVSQHGGCP
jgi:hypothetical protein